MKISVLKEDLHGTNVLEQLQNEIISNAVVSSHIDEDMLCMHVSILLHEMFTNALRHITGSVATFDLTFEDDSFCLAMETDGDGFKLKPFNVSGPETVFLFPRDRLLLKDREITVYNDGESAVICNIEDNSTLIFRADKIGPNVIQIDEFPEHYGLSIFTQLCDSVIYRRTAKDTDIFTLKKKIR